MPIYAIVGPAGSGKTAIREYLRQERNIFGIESGAVMQDMLSAAKVGTPYQLIGKQGTTAVATESVERMLRSIRAEVIRRQTPLRRLPVIIAGLGMVQQVVQLKDRTGPVRLIGLDADEQVCFVRSASRGNGNRYGSLQQFIKERLEPDYASGLRQIMQDHVSPKRRIDTTFLSLDEVIEKVEPLIVPA